MSVTMREITTEENQEENDKMRNAPRKIPETTHILCFSRFICLLDKVKPIIETRRETGRENRVCAHRTKL